MRRDRTKDPVYYHFIINNKDICEKIDESFYDGSVLKDIYELARKHVMLYGSAPSKEDILASVRMLDIPDEEKTLKYDNARVNILYERASEMRNYSPNVMIDEIKSLWRWESLKSALAEGAQEFRLNDDSVNSENIEETVNKILRSLDKAKIDDFEEREKGEEVMDFWNPDDHKRVKVDHYSTGMDFLDIVLKGGWWPGSMHLFIGAPKSGKSMWLCDIACRSVLNGINTVYVTLETQTCDVSSRISRNMLDCTEDEYEMSIGDPEALRSVFSKFRAKHKVGEFSIIRFAANTMTPQQIEEKILKREEKMGIKFKNVIIDYLQIEKSPVSGGNSDNLYVSGKRIAEESRASATRNDWCLISAIQASKAQYGASSINETHVSESSGYNATVDSMIGLVKDPDCPGMGMYKLTVIYDRVADYQGMSKMFRFNKTHLRMEETQEPMYRDGESETYAYAKKMEASIVNSKTSEKFQTQSMHEGRTSALFNRGPALATKSINTLSDIPTTNPTAAPVAPVEIHSTPEPVVTEVDIQEVAKAHPHGVVIGMSVAKKVEMERKCDGTHYSSGKQSYYDVKRCNPRNRCSMMMGYMASIQKI